MRSNTYSPIILGRPFLEQQVQLLTPKKGMWSFNSTQEVYGSLSKEEDKCSEVQVPSWHLPILK
jgi:hypothetical protein